MVGKCRGSILMLCGTRPVTLSGTAPECSATAGGRAHCDRFAPARDDAEYGTANISIRSRLLCRRCLVI
jgi:hypothetical protein